MRPLPTGTVTFLITDIEGSTRLLQRLGERYPAVLEDHIRILRSAVDLAGGVEVNTLGDGLFAAFSDARSGLAAAVAAQQGLVNHEWPEGASVRVRVGLHTGKPIIAGDDYVGLDVHRAARICAAAHGGQVLLSADTRKAIVEPDDETAFRDLGQHRLKDIDAPEHLYQAVVPGLICEFPPPHAVGINPHNLRAEVTEFIGRARELRDIGRILGETRLVTLAGPGGAGKTRLALRAAAEALPGFDDGVFFVPLAAVSDARHVPAAVGQALGVRETDGRAIEDVLAEQLRTKRLLLVIDNFEQVLPAARWLNQLLAAAPGVKVLATSRARLRLRGEHVFEVPPLEAPSGKMVLDLAALARIEAVDLFVRRVQAADPAFSITFENAASVAEIVVRLEGLPLAIELAAARCRLFTPKDLLARLGRRFAVLRGGPSDLPDRQRALRDTVAWSYDLLAPAEQVMFRRLGIFMGGFTPEAAEIVGAGPPVDDPIEALASLLDQSLVRSRALYGEGRFTMLETIREYALEELEAAGETQATAERHAAYFASMVEEAEPYLTGQAQAETIDRLAADQANIRLALEFCLDTSDIETGLRIAGRLWRFWHATGQMQDGRLWLERLQRQAADAPAALRAMGLSGLAGLAYWEGDYTTALANYDGALALYRSLGDRANEADTLFSMSTTSTWGGHAEAGARLAAQALEMFEVLGAKNKVGMVLMAQGFARWMNGDLAGARPLWERSLAIAREVGDHVEAEVKRLALASIDAKLGQRDAALRDVLSSLEELVRLRNVTYTIMALDWVAALAAEYEPDGAARLGGAAEALRVAHGGGMRPSSSGLEDARVVAARLLDPAVLEDAWSEGEEMDLEQAIEYARGLGARLYAPARLDPSTA